MTSSTEATETAVIVPIEAAEPAVAEHRRRLDVAASWGVPAHVSVLYPFLPPGVVDDAVIGRLKAAVQSVQAFDCTFARVQWFGEEVVWLAPEPDQPFRELTSAVWKKFPEHPPYGGAFDDVIPHLTIGERRRGSARELHAAEVSVCRQLPLTARVDRALLLAGTTEPDSWHVVCELPLAPA